MISQSDLLTLASPLVSRALLPTRTLNFVTRSDDDDAPSNPSCTTAVPGEHGQVPLDACNNYYNAPPEFTPALVTAIIFGILTLSHLVQAIMYRKPYAWVVIMGGLWETVAFSLHTLGAHDMQNQGYATTWIILFLLAPLWINAFAYMSMARMVLYYSPTQAVGWLRADRMTILFVLADFLLFVVQAAGGVLATPGADANTIKIGLNIYIAGTAAQQLFIVLFVVVMILFHRNMIKLDSLQGGKGRSDIEAANERQVKKNWRPLLYAMYATLALITVRICFRIAEFAPGVDTNNQLLFKEIYPYMLDVFPMALALLILAVIHPGRTLIGPGSEFPKKTRAEKKAAKQAKKDDKARKKAAKKGGDLSGSYVEINQDQLGMTGQDPRGAQAGYEMSHGVTAGYTSSDQSVLENVDLGRRQDNQYWRPT